MKKVNGQWSILNDFFPVFVLLILVFGPWSVVCYASPLYGPKMPERGKWYTGFETNLVFGRDMHKGLGSAESCQYFYNASYGIYDWFSFDGKLGVGDFEFDTRDLGRLDYNFGFSGAYGVRFKVYNNEEEKLKAILGFQHISIHPPKRELNGVKYAAIWDEWQISFLVSKDLWKLEPYLGMKISQLYIIRKDTLQDDWAWNGARDHFGILVGSSVDLSDIYVPIGYRHFLRNWFLNLEARFIDETAFEVALSYKL